MKCREGPDLNIVVHPPVNPEAARALRERVAAVHAQAVARYLEELACPSEQKRQLIEKIEESVGT